MNMSFGTTCMTRSLASAAACFALAGLIGCGGGGGSDKATISGKVTYNDKPVTGGTLTLYSSTGAPYPVNIKEDGTFNVSGDTHRADGGGNRHRPRAVAPPAGSTAAPAPPHVVLPAKYKDPKTSGLTWEVKGGKNTKNFDLTN